MPDGFVDLGQVVGKDGTQIHLVTSETLSAPVGAVAGDMVVFVGPYEKEYVYIGNVQAVTGDMVQINSLIPFITEHKGNIGKPGTQIYPMMANGPMPTNTQIGDLIINTGEVEITVVCAGSTSIAMFPGDVVRILEVLPDTLWQLIGNIQGPKAQQMLTPYFVGAMPFMDLAIVSGNGNEDCVGLTSGNPRGMYKRSAVLGDKLVQLRKNWLIITNTTTLKEYKKYAIGFGLHGYNFNIFGFIQVGMKLYIFGAGMTGHVLVYDVEVDILTSVPLGVMTGWSEHSCIVFEDRLVFSGGDFGNMGYVGVLMLATNFVHLIPISNWGMFGHYGAAVRVGQQVVFGHSYLQGGNSILIYDKNDLASLYGGVFFCTGGNHIMSYGHWGRALIPGVTRCMSVYNNKVVLAHSSVGNSANDRLQDRIWIYDSDIKSITERIIPSSMLPLSLNRNLGSNGGNGVFSIKEIDPSAGAFEQSLVVLFWQYVDSAVATYEPNSVFYSPQLLVYDVLQDAFGFFELKSSTGDGSTEVEMWRCDTCVSVKGKYIFPGWCADGYKNGNSRIIDIRGTPTQIDGLYNYGVAPNAYFPSYDTLINDVSHLVLTSGAYIVRGSKVYFSTTSGRFVVLDFDELSYIGVLGSSPFLHYVTDISPELPARALFGTFVSSGSAYYWVPYGKYVYLLSGTSTSVSGNKDSLWFCTLDIEAEKTVVTRVLQGAPGIITSVQQGIGVFELVGNRILTEFSTAGFIGRRCYVIYKQVIPE